MHLKAKIVETTFVVSRFSETESWLKYFFWQFSTFFVNFNVQRFGNRFCGGEGTAPYKATFLPREGVIIDHDVS